MDDRSRSRSAAIKLAVFFLVVISVISGTRAQADFPLEAMTAGSIDSLSKTVDTFLDNEGSDLRWHQTITRVGSDYLRIRFSEFSNPESEEFQFTIKNADGTVVLNYSHDSFPSGDFWTPVIFGDRALIQLRSAKVLDSLTFILNEVAFQTDGGGWMSLIGTDDREPIINYVNNTDIWEASRSIAKLSFFKNGFFVCTGFMISSSRMMTNNHCVAKNKVCATTTAIFGFQKNANGAVDSGEQFACKEVVATDVEKDYTILELAGSPGDRWGTLTLDSSDVDDGAEIYIIQHPAGEPKQISKVNCQVDRAVVDGRGSDTDMAHVCDTLGGSSGSPVLSESNTVIGLHHFGVGQAAFWNKNRAVRMKLIIDEIGVLP